MALLSYMDNDIIFTIYADDNELTDGYIIDERLFLINYAELKDKLNNINEKSEIYNTVINEINNIKNKKHLSKLNNFEIEIDIGYIAINKSVYFVNREHILSILSALFNLNIRDCNECDVDEKYLEEYKLIEDDIYKKINEDDEELNRFYTKLSIFRDKYIDFYYDQLSYFESYDKVYIKIPIEKLFYKLLDVIDKLYILSKQLYNNTNT